MKIRLTDLRRATQLFALLWANSYLGVVFTRTIYKGPLKGSCTPFLNCHACPAATFSCPVGTLQHYMSVHRFPFLLVGQLGLVGMLVGRMACGWLCPVGLFQDLLHSLKLGYVQISRVWAHLRYVVLALLVIAIPWATGEHWFSKLCPEGTLIAGIPWVLWNPVDPETGAPVIAPGAVGWLFALKLGILASFVVLSLFIKRPFCRVGCPLGLLLSFFNRFSLFRLDVSSTCNHCNVCQQRCPVDLKVYENPNSDECIRCLACTECACVTKTGVPLFSGSSRQKRLDQAPTPPPPPA
jgi:ferredoxin-type protein NapH